MNVAIGQPIRRVEDDRLLRGQGRFLEDVRLAHETHAVVLRSPHAHARIRSLDTAAARAAPGVLAILTHADLAAEGVKPLPPMTRDPRYEIRNSDGSRMPEPEHWPLARDKVRHVGDPVAFVVAETRAQALDAAALIAVDYQPLPAVIDAESARAPGAPALHDGAPGNCVLEWSVGDRKATNEAFAKAHGVTRLRLHNNRLICAYLEPRAAMASVAGDAITLYASGQGAHRFRETLSFCLGVAQDDVRVVMGDVGGGFGPRGFFQPENVLVALAARRLGRPVRWIGDRAESFTTDVQARDHAVECAIALDASGRFLALDVTSDWNMGAYIPARAVFAQLAHMGPVIPGAYRFGAVHFTIRGYLTNMAPIYALRGIGRAEASHILERLIEEAAHEMKLDRVEIRRRNLVPASAMPYDNKAGSIYDSGEFEAIMDKALALSDWRGFAARKAQSRARGLLRGIGLCNFVENAGGAPSEFAEVKADPARRLDLYVGSGPSGQGHETVYAQVLAAELSLAFEDVRTHIGDTALVKAGSGSAASRSMRKAGSAVVLGARIMVEKGKILAGDMMEATPADIEYSSGRFRVAGTDKSVHLYDVAAHACAKGEELSGAIDHKQPEETFPNGCQVAEVEIDPETGTVKLVRHSFVNDVGRVINPLLLDGQLHGGVAQGVGQAMTERTVYGADGQLLSGSFMDYCIPRADDMPMFATAFHEVPCANNPLGVKGAGEGGTTGAPPAIVNAVIDALRDFGATDIDMPALPETVWRAIATRRPG